MDPYLLMQLVFRGTCIHKVLMQLVFGGTCIRRVGPRPALKRNKGDAT